MIKPPLQLSFCHYMKIYNHHGAKNVLEVKQSLSFEARKILDDNNKYSETKFINRY